MQAVLGSHLGRALGSMHDDLIPAHLWCTECGTRNMSVRLHPPMKEGGGALD